MSALELPVVPSFAMLDFNVRPHFCLKTKLAVVGASEKWVTLLC